MSVLAASSEKMAASAPLKMVEKTDTDPAKSYYVVRKYKDTFIPSITLSLALEYMHRKMSDLEVVLGKYIRIPNPEKFNVDTQQWEKYSLHGDPAAGGQGRKHREAGRIPHPLRGSHPHRRDGRHAYQLHGRAFQLQPRRASDLPRALVLGVRWQSAAARSRHVAGHEEAGQRHRDGGSLCKGNGRRRKAHALRADVRGGDARQCPEHHPDGQLPYLRLTRRQHAAALHRGNARVPDGVPAFHDLVLGRHPWGDHGIFFCRSCSCSSSRTTS